MKYALTLLPAKYYIYIYGEEMEETKGGKKERTKTKQKQNKNKNKNTTKEK
jgi:hypothetical protein